MTNPLPQSGAAGRLFDPASYESLNPPELSVASGPPGVATPWSELPVIRELPLTPNDTDTQPIVIAPDFTAESRLTT